MKTKPCPDTFVSQPRRFLPFCFLVCAAFLAAPVPLLALILTGKGNTPVHDNGWPSGALEVANLKTRVGWWEGPPFGGGEHHFQYRGDTAAFVETLKSFAAIRAPALELVLRDGTHESPFLKDKDDPKSDARVDWEFTIWRAESWHHLYNNPRSYFASDQPNFRQPVAAPRLDLYLGAGSKVDWRKVKVPAGVRLRDERASAAGVKPQGGAMLRADVFDIADGKPVRGARVTVAKYKNQAGYEQVSAGASDATGRVQLEKIPEGTHRITVSAEGYAPRMVAHESFGPGSFRSIAVELAKSASLSGVVTDNEGKPIPGMKLRPQSTMAMDGRGYPSPDRLEAETDAQGRFEFTGLPAGFTQVWVSDVGFHQDPGGFTRLYDVPAKDVAIRVARTGVMRVRVLDRDGRPMGKFEGSEVNVHVERKEGGGVGKWGGSGRVKEDGTIEFNGVHPGEYRVTCAPNPSTASRKYADEQLVTIEGGKTTEVKIVFR